MNLFFNYEHYVDRSFNTVIELNYLAVTNQKLKRFSKKKYGEKNTKSALKCEKTLTELVSMMTANQMTGINLLNPDISRQSSTNIHHLFSIFYNGGSE